MKPFHPSKFLACFFVVAVFSPALTVLGQTKDATENTWIVQFNQDQDKKADPDHDTGMTLDFMARTQQDETYLEDPDAANYDPSVVSEYWIGIQCVGATETPFRSQELEDLTLKLDGGMLVNSVTEGQATEAAGMEVNDVIYAFGGERINGLNDLFIAIGEAKDEATEVTVIRDGAIKKLKITPRLREAESSLAVDAEFGRVISDLDILFKNKLLEGELKIPDGYEIVLRAKSGAEAQLTVKKGENHWEIDQATLAKLPGEIYPTALQWYEFARKRSLRYQHAPNQELISWDAVLAGDLKKDQAQWLASRFASQNSLTRKLSSLEKQISELTKMVMELRTALKK